MHNGLVRDDSSAQAAIDLFASRGVQGIIIGTMTYGDALAAASIAEALDLPILVFGTKEMPSVDMGRRRSDAFGGTLAVTSALYRRKLPYLFAGVVWPEEDDFSQQVQVFARACAIVEGFYGTRIGVVGLRPERLEESSFSEATMIQRYKQRVAQISWHEVLRQAATWSDDDPAVLATLNQIQKGVDCSDCAPETLAKIAHLELALKRYCQERGLDALAASCGGELEAEYGLCACSTLGRLTGQGIMATPGTDVHGALTMRVQHLAALGNALPFAFEWTVRHQQMENVFLAWNCGSAPACLANDLGAPRLMAIDQLLPVVSQEPVEGVIEFQLEPGVVTISRLVDYEGRFKMLVTSGEMLPTNELIRGVWGWVRVPDLDALYHLLATEGFVPRASLIHGNLCDAIESFCSLVDIDVVRV